MIFSLCMVFPTNHTLMSQAGMAHHKVKHVAKACKALVAFINDSNVARNHLKEFQEFLDFENILTVIQEVEVRWNSMKHLVNSMDFSDWDFLEELSAFLAPFEELTEVLSGDKYVTIIYA